MLGSDYEGERATAALKISTMAKKHKVTIVELCAMKPDPVTPKHTTVHYGSDDETWTYTQWGQDSRRKNCDILYEIQEIANTFLYLLNEEEAVFVRALTNQFLMYVNMNDEHLSPEQIGKCNTIILKVTYASMGQKK